MRFWTPASVALAAALLASLAIKATTRQPPEPDRALFTEVAAARMTKAGFAVGRVSRPSGVYLFGTRDACRIMLTEQEAMGNLAARNAQFARPVGPLRLVWTGRAYDRPPRARIVTDFLFRRELVRVGLSPPRRPLAAVAASAACPTDAATALAPTELPR